MLNALRTTTAAFTIDGARVALEARIYEDSRFSLCGTFQGSLGQNIDTIGAFNADSSDPSEDLEKVVATWETYHLQPIPADEADAVFALLASLDGSDIGTAPGLNDLNDLDNDLQSDRIAENVEIYRAWARSKGIDLDNSEHGEALDGEDFHTFEEARAVIALDKEGSDYVSDWSYGVRLIPEDEFEDYAREFADDVGAVRSDAAWPNNWIDWKAAADELKVDFTSIEYKGKTYYAL